MEALTLKEALVWVLQNGGAGALTYLLFDKIGYLKAMAPDYKRYASMAMAAILALLAWGAGMAMQYLQVPIDWRGWIEASFSTIAVALATSFTLHGLIDLRKKRLDEENNK